MSNFISAFHLFSSELSISVIIKNKATGYWVLSNLIGIQKKAVETATKSKTKDVFTSFHNDSCRNSDFFPSLNLIQVFIMENALPEIYRQGWQLHRICANVKQSLW